MKTVRFHRFTKHSDTDVRLEPGGAVVDRLATDSWLGVVDERDGWYKIISAQVDGWVRISDCYAASLISLSAILKAPGQPILNYAATS